MPSVYSALADVFCLDIDAQKDGGRDLRKLCWSERFAPIVRIKIATLLAVLYVSLGLSASAQTARISASEDQIAVGETTFLDLQIESGATLPVWAAELTLTLPEGVEVVLLDLPGGGSRPDILVDEGQWLANVTKIEGNRISIAVTAGGELPACSGLCPVASIRVRGVTAGLKSVGFATESGKNRALRDNQNLSEVRFTILQPVSFQVGGEGEDSDADGIPNDLEESLGLVPDDDDSDNDGILDGDEDFDGDGIANKLEVTQGTNPAIFKGDVDGDKTLTLDDASAIILRVFNRLSAAQVNESVADVDGEAGLTLDDASAIILRVFNRIGHLG